MSWYISYICTCLFEAPWRDPHGRCHCVVANGGEQMGAWGLEPCGRGNYSHVRTGLHLACMCTTPSMLYGHGDHLTGTRPLHWGRPCHTGGPWTHAPRWDRKPSPGECTAPAAPRQPGRKGLAVIHSMIHRRFHTLNKTKSHTMPVCSNATVEVSIAEPGYGLQCVVGSSCMRPCGVCQCICGSRPSINVHDQAPVGLRPQHETDEFFVIICDVASRN